MNKKGIKLIAQSSQEEIERIIPKMVAAGIGSEEEIRELIAEVREKYFIKEAKEIIQIISYQNMLAFFLN